MRFLLDMGISPATATFLRRLGHDAAHLRELGLHTLPDAEILRKARAEERILLTHDLDFSDLLAAGGESLPGVVVFRLRNMHPENVNRHLGTILAEHASVLDRDVIVSVTEGRIRVRSLPFE